MIGFDNGAEKYRTLDGSTVASINANLTSELDITAAKVLRENSNIAFIGTQKGGAFDLSPDIAGKMLSASVNPNGRPNSDVVRPWINGFDVTRRPRGFYIVDFGTEMSLEEAALYEAPFEYVNKHVREYRTTTNSEARTSVVWWLHQRPRPEMRQAIAPLSRYVVTPRVAKHRVFCFANVDAVPDSRLAVIARDDDYFFGVLQSHIHEIWSLATSPRHGAGNDPTYNNRACFETYPFPWPPGEEPEGDSRIEAIAEAAHRLDELRRNWLNPEGASETELKKRTLTNLYNARPMWLENAHKRLDEAVFAAYGWPEDISDEEILRNLLALNLERSEPGLES